jgi:CHAT domain-containing protein/tetratricopeptide (TPR) repeat protein
MKKTGTALSDGDVDTVSARHRDRTRVVIPAAVLLVAGALGWSIRQWSSAPLAIRALRRAAASQHTRGFQPRLTVFDEDRRPAATSRGGDRPDPAPLTLQSAAGMLLANVAAAPDHASSRAAALLVLGRTSDAVRELGSAAATDAHAASDLAGALLVASERTSRIELAIDALAAADDALRLDPRLAPASFNRALALQRLGFLSEAREEWLRCAKTESGSEWSAEAGAAAAAVTTESDAAGWKRQSSELEHPGAADTGTIRRLVQHYPQLARGHGEGVYLGRWAEGNAPALAIARAIGEELRRTTGESMLHDAVAAIDGAAADPRRLEGLRNGHLLYRHGRLAFRDHHLDEAERKLLQAEEAFRRGGSPMQRVARYYRGAVLYESSRVGEAERLLDDAAASSPEKLGYLALAAQIGWERGLCRMVGGSFTEAARILTTSRDLLAALRETELEATFDLHLAQLASYVGDDEEGWSHRQRAFVRLSQTGNDYRIAVAADALASSLVRREQWRRAAALATVAAAMSTRLQQAELAAEAFLLRSAALVPQDLAARADDDIAAAGLWIAKIGDRSIVARLEAERAVAAAAALRSRNAGAALIELDRAIAFYEQSGHRIFLPRVYLDRGRIHRARGDTGGAERDLATGIAIAEAQREDFPNLEQRAAFFAASRALFVEAAGLALAKGDPSAALEMLERGNGRAVLDAFAAPSRTERPLTAPELSDSLAPDAAIVVYALLPDRLAAFVVRDRDVRVVQTKADPRRINALIARLAAASAGELTAIEDAETGLHNALLAPIEPLLSGVRTVAVVADSAFDHIPMNLLRSRGTGRLAVDDYTFVEAPSASVAVACSRRPALENITRPLVIASNAFEASDATPLLPAVTAEVRKLNDLWPDANMLAGGAASRAGFLSNAASARLIHFAGHGVDRSGRPSESKLLLAMHEEITAGAIARLDLHETRLVVLNACRTAAASGRSDGVLNIATAFVIAGVPTVIATATNVDDAAAGELAERLHRYLRDGVEPALALRNVLRDEIRIIGPAKAATSYGGFATLGGSASLVRQNRERKGSRSR